MANNGTSKPKQATLDKPANGVPSTQEFPEYRAIAADRAAVDNFVQTLMQNLAGETLTVRDLTKVTVPAQGYEVWSLPNPEKPNENQYPQTIEGVIVNVQTPRAWWPKSFEEMGRTPPECSSFDSINGFGSPDGQPPAAHDCMTCVHNQWGTSSRGNGKACREQRLLFLIRPEDLLPIVIQVPVTSIEPWRKYVVNLSLGPQLPYWHAYTRLALTKVEGEGVPYSVIVPTLAGVVDHELRPKLDHYMQAINAILGRTNYIPDPPHPALQGNGQNQQQPNGDEPDGRAEGDNPPGETQDEPSDDSQQPADNPEREPVAAEQLPNVRF